MDAPKETNGSAEAHSERRRTPRVDVRLPLASHLSSARVRVANVSAGGCLVYATHLLTPGHEHQLSLRTRSENLYLTVRIVHVMRVTGDPDFVCAAGVEFTDIDSAAQRAAIERLIAVTGDDSQPKPAGLD